MKPTPGKIALIFLLAGACWFAVSDIALASLSGERVTSSQVITREMIKGVVYVSVTSLLLYFLIRYYFRYLNRSRTAYHDLFEDNPSPMLAFDPDTLRVLAVNNASLYLYGYNKKEFLAMTVDQIKHREDIPRFLEVVRSGVSSFDKTKIQRHFTKGGKLLYVNVLVQNGFLNNKKVRWALIRDLTEVKENERLLEEALERYDLTMKATKDLIWDWSSNKGLTEIHGQLNELFGYDKSSVDLNWFDSKIHPDDIERIVLGIRAANESLNPFWSDQFRFQSADGSYKYVNVRGHFLYGKDKKPCRSIGTVQVIQKQKEYEQKIERQNKLLKEIAHKVSHDLRGPVASMKGILSLMAESKNIPSTMDQEFQCVIRCTDELDDVIHDVMNKANKVYQG